MAANVVEIKTIEFAIRGTKSFDRGRDFRPTYRVSDEGWRGVPAGDFRFGMLHACRIASRSVKLGIFFAADGFDQKDFTPLVRIYEEPEPWAWSARLRARFYEGSPFSKQDIVRLIHRLGEDGVPETRDGRIGTFEVVGS